MKKSSLLRQYWGFNSFRSGQEKAVKNILSGKDTLVIMPTGAGKSLIYQYAALAIRQNSNEKCAVSLVISPLIALMKDQVDSLVRLGIEATYINSTLQLGEQRLRSSQMLQGQYQLVYVAPERLRQSGFVEALKSIDIQLFVIDEAHCISSWGHDFRPDYRRIAEVRKELGQPLTVALTATATTLVQDDIVQLLNMPTAARVVTGFNRPNLSFEVVYASSAQTKLQEVVCLLQEQFGSDTTINFASNGACIIYAATRKETEEVAAFIGEKFPFCCAFYHAGMSTAQREKVQDAFSLGKLCIIVATNAFGMGIDRQDVRLVIHYNMPGTLEAYYQEAGRAGRDGQPSRAVLLFASQDRSLQYFFIRQKSISLEDLYTAFQSLYSLPICSAEDHIGHALRLCRPQEFARSLGWESKKFRIVLAYLEKTGILQNTELTLLGNDDSELRLILGEWDKVRASESMRELEEHSRHRKSQLEQMCHYAQADACRRKILLSYFSDQSSLTELSTEYCCDYCHRQELRRVLQVKKRKGSDENPVEELGRSSLEQLSRTERAALIVLDSIRQLAQNGVSVGRQRIAQMLSGSKSQKMSHSFRSQRYYGRLAAVSQKQIEQAIDECLQSGFLQHRSLENSEVSVIALTQQGNNALEQKEAIVLKAFGSIDHVAQRSNRVVGKEVQVRSASTVAQTLELLQQGLSLEQVAQVRSLHLSTISTHVSKLIEQGELMVADYVRADVLQLVEECLQQLYKSGSDLQQLRSIKDMLPQKVSYDEIKLVLGAWRRRHHG